MQTQAELSVFFILVVWSVTSQAIPLWETLIIRIDYSLHGHQQNMIDAEFSKKQESSTGSTPSAGDAFDNIAGSPT